MADGKLHFHMVVFYPCKCSFGANVLTSVCLSYAGYRTENKYSNINDELQDAFTHLCHEMREQEILLHQSLRL